MTLFEKAERYPPNVCRLLAKKIGRGGYRPKSNRDIAGETGLHQSYVGQLSLRRSWKGIPIDVVVKFSQACGVDLLRTENTRRFIRERKRAHIKNADKKQLAVFARLISNAD